MKTTGVSLALLVLLAATALAQIPRTINYQGRAIANGQPVTGTHQMNIRLYDAATGGTALYTETHNVNFTSEGIFTVVIGSQTPIPEEIAFDQRYWLGVRITGVNGGNELLPRQVLSSTPYSFRAEIANDLSLPATFQSTEHGAPILDVTNDGNNSIGIQGSGTEFGVVSIGPAATTKHYVAHADGQLGDDGTPVPGAYYYDNAPIAWATIDANGNSLADFGVERISHKAQSGVYEITLSTSVELVPPSNPSLSAFAPVITPGPDFSTDTPIVIPAWLIKRDATGTSPNTLIVYLRDPSGQALDFNFSIVVFGRPQ